MKKALFLILMVASITSFAQLAPAPEPDLVKIRRDRIQYFAAGYLTSATTTILLRNTKRPMLYGLIAGVGFNLLTQSIRKYNGRRWDWQGLNAATYGSFAGTITVGIPITICKPVKK